MKDWVSNSIGPLDKSHKAQSRRILESSMNDRLESDGLGSNTTCVTLERCPHFPEALFSGPQQEGGW
jgi:hypothetical protein